jgi:hypothetical protein
MSKWLTTGQMLDQLKSGEIAQYKTKYKTGYVKRLGDTIVYCDIYGNEIMKDENIFHTVALDKGIVNAEWSILPQYVSFEEAYEAGKQGKVINFHAKDGVVHRIEHFDDSLDENGLSCYCLMELFEGNWSIED